jgi:sialidase-1
MTEPSRRMFLGWAGAAFAVGLAGARPLSDTNGPTETDLFVAGKDGYHTYRIPSLLVTAKGTLLALCEGRKRGRADAGDIDVLLKRSLDGGATWQPVQVVADDGANTVGNPCPVLDRRDGTVWLPLTRNLGRDTERQILDGTSQGTRTVLMLKSTDDGVTWSKPVDVTATTKAADWTWYATGPGCGIQMRSGRLIIPCDHAVKGTQVKRSHVVYSDDHGVTWQRGGALGDHTNECQVVERSDGSLLLNMRSYHRKNRRAIATSKDGGLTWSDVTLDETLVEPTCQASLIWLTEPWRGKGRLLFANPATTRREKMTVRLSCDEGRTWPVAKRLYDGPAAYSALAVPPDGTVACLYERGRRSAYESITLARFSPEWLSR